MEDLGDGDRQTLFAFDASMAEYIAANLTRDTEGRERSVALGGFRQFNPDPDERLGRQKLQLYRTRLSQAKNACQVYAAYALDIYSDAASASGGDDLADASSSSESSGDSAKAPSENPVPPHIPHLLAANPVLDADDNNVTADAARFDAFAVAPSSQAAVNPVLCAHANNLAAGAANIEASFATASSEAAENPILDEHAGNLPFDAAPVEAFAAAAASSKVSSTSSKRPSSLKNKQKCSIHKCPGHPNGDEHGVCSADNCLKSVHPTCFKDILQPKYNLADVEGSLFCSAGCYRQTIKNMTGTVSWETDGKTGKTGPNSSMAILIKWLLEPGNLAKWRGKREHGGRSKNDIAKEIATLINNEGVR